MKQIIITGASGSVGSATVLAMARKGWHVIMACRNLAKAEDVRKQVLSKVPDASIELQQLELGSRESIRQFAEAMQGRQIDALFNNAGIMCRNFSRTSDGIEQSMAVNYLDTVLLTHLLLPSLSKGASIVNMVSLTTKYARLSIDWPEWGEDHFGQLTTYGSSKLALLYYSIAFAKRHPEFHVNVADPGIVDSNMITMGRWFDPLADIFFRPFIKTPEQGAAPAISAILSDNATMKYFVGKKQKDIPSRFVNSPLVEQLWQQANEMLSL